MITDPARDDHVQASATHLYDAECALRAAHQTHVDAWIAAATDKLHAALAAHLAAVAAQPDPPGPKPRPRPRAGAPTAASTHLKEQR